MEPLANPAWQVVVAVVIALLAARLALGKAQSPLGKQIAELAESLAIAIFLVFLVIRPFVVQAYFIPSGSMCPTLVQGDRILVNKFIYRFVEPSRGDVIVFKSPVAANKDEKDFIKRVIGVPGDEIRLTPGYVMIGEDKFDHDRLGVVLADYAGSRAAADIRIKLQSDGVYLNGARLTDKQVATAAGKPLAKVKVHPGALLRNGRRVTEYYTAEDPDAEFPSLSTEVNKVTDGTLFMMGDNRNESSDSRAWGLLERKRVEGKAMFVFWPIDRLKWIK